MPMFSLIENAGLDDITGVMSRMLREGSCHPMVRALAERAIEESPGKSREAAIYDFVKNNLDYVPDPIDTELFVHPKKIAKDFFDGKKRVGDCDDHALLVSAMLNSIGTKSRIALIDVEGQGLDHALAQADLEELGWTNFDTTTSKPLGWEIKSHSTVHVTS